MTRNSLLPFWGHVLVLSFVVILLGGGVFFSITVAEKPAAKNGENLAGGEANGKKVRYSTDVRPILSKCLHCHGTDEKTRGGDLRLDTEKGAKADLGGYYAIVEGKPSESELIERIHSDDEDLIMPPVDSKIKLTQKEKATLKKWIEQGAQFEAHWAFQKPSRPALPSVENKSWCRNPIDHFILARLEKEKRSPSSEADRLTLVRRVYLDLIGLPPTPTQADAFLDDTKPDAYERLVDQLLASPHYGERWGRNWLDLARYADTNGYEKDQPRSIWAYRDWVIKAFNDDMPFDQFTIEQIAGDLLPNATLSQKIATGFHRNTLLNEEGGVEVEQFRFESIVDRVNTTGTVWLGMTIGCAQCHTHKYDPIVHDEYYQMMAFLNNCDEPKLNLPDPKIEEARQKHFKLIDKMEHDLRKQFDALLKKEDVDTQFASRFAKWKKEKRELCNHWVPLKAKKSQSWKNATFTMLDDKSLLMSGNRPNNDVYTLEFHPNFDEIGLKKIAALRLEALPDESLPGDGPGRSPIGINQTLLQGDFLVSEFELRTASQPRSPKAGSKETQWELATLKNPTASYYPKNSEPRKVIDKAMDTGWKIGTQKGKANHLIVQLEKPISKTNSRFQIKLHQIYIHNMVLGRFRISACGEEKQPVVTSGLTAEVEELLLKSEEKLSESERWKVERAFLLSAPELSKQVAKIDVEREKKPRFQTTLVMQERLPKDSRTTHLRERGEYRKPKHQVQLGVPALLHTLPKDTPPTRLVFAKWLINSENPLVGRVTVNRQWEAIFGTGIVKTSDDFGMQSSPPSHPELLDWLATEWIGNGWSMKKLHRLIVTSATYRQQSHVTENLKKRDPNNILLARGPRIRVSAETVRDIVLSASELLDKKIGGVSVYPPQPPEAGGLSFGRHKWKVSTGGDRYRRGMYTFQKRTNPYAMFGTFDAPSGDTCIVRRGRSNTPLQSLTLLNDEVFMEAARALAKKELLDGPAGNREKVIDIYRRFLTRSPDKKEQDLILGFYETQLKRLAAKELDADEILGISKPNRAVKNSSVKNSSAKEKTKKKQDDEQDALPAIDHQQWAAWTSVVRVVLNFDATITKE